MTREPHGSLGADRFRCDGCGQITEIPRNSASAPPGWTRRLESGVERHYCPGCADGPSVGPT